MFGQVCDMDVVLVYYSGFKVISKKKKNTSSSRHHLTSQAQGIYKAYGGDAMFETINFKV